MGLTEDYDYSKIDTTYDTPQATDYVDQDGNPVNAWQAVGDGYQYNVLYLDHFGDEPSWKEEYHYFKYQNITVEFMFPVGALLYIWQISYGISYSWGTFKMRTSAEAADIIAANDYIQKVWASTYILGPDGVGYT